MQLWAHLSLSRNSRDNLCESEEEKRHLRSWNKTKVSHIKPLLHHPLWEETTFDWLFDWLYGVIKAPLQRVLTLCLSLNQILRTSLQSVQGLKQPERMSAMLSWEMDVTTKWRKTDSKIIGFQSVAAIYQSHWGKRSAYMGRCCSFICSESFTNCSQWRTL